MRAGAIRAVGGVVSIPAVAPDGIGALSAAAGLFAFTGMDRLEVIDVAIGLVEVAVAVVVVAVPDIERRQVGVDLGQCLACGNLSVVPGIDGVIDEHPGLGADDAAAVVARRRQPRCRAPAPNR